MLRMLVCKKLVSTSFSSFQIADAITTMDLSLPSYGEISDPKASVGTVSSLTIDSPTEGLGVKARKPAASKTKKSEGGGLAIDVSKVLPSLAKGPRAAVDASSSDNRSAPTRKERTAAKQDDEPAPAVKFMDMDMPSYGETATIKDTNPFRL